MYGQRWDTPPAAPAREVIATAIAVTPEKTTTPPAPRSPVANAPGSPNQTPVANASGSSSAGAIQQVAFVPDPPHNAPPDQTPAAAPMLPPTALLSGMASSPAATNTPNPTETQAATLSVEVVGQDRVLLGEKLVHEIVIRNRGVKAIAEVHVEEPLPEGVRALAIDPPAVARDSRLVWDLRHLEAGGERRLKVELNPGRAEALDLRPYVTFLNGSGLRTQVVRPPFGVEISADRTKAMRGERVRFNIQLANHGVAPIQNIKIYDMLPSGLHHPAGRKIGIEHFGDLQPGQRCTIALETTAVESGTFHNEVLAQADRGVEANASLDVVITEPNLSLRVEGPAKTLTQREVDFHVEVANPGALAAKSVRVVQALPPTFEVVSASSGASLDINQHALVWSLPDLGAGHRQTFTFRIKANTAGDWPMSAAVLSQNFPEARVQNTLHAEAAAVLKVEVRAREENLSVGEETVVRMRVFNNGDAPCTGLRLTATLPDAVTAVKAEGPSSEQVENQQVRFAPLPQLDAHGDVVYRLHLRGRQTGKGPLRVEVTADKQAPAVHEVSIQVQEAKLATTGATTGKLANSSPGETLR
jgi:uncharacterized repeat protein (TIGR01451 family)